MSRLNDQNERAFAKPIPDGWIPARRDRVWVVRSPEWKSLGGWVVGLQGVVLWTHPPRLVVVLVKKQGGGYYKRTYDLEELRPARVRATDFGGRVCQFCRVPLRSANGDEWDGCLVCLERAAKLWTVRGRVREYEYRRRRR